MNAFKTFSLEPSLSIDLDQLKQSYKNLAASHHPDSGGEKAEFEKVNLAYAALQSPAKRLKAYMEIQEIPHDSRGAVSNDLMDLFMQVGSLVQEADAFIRKKSSATSVLAKALLEGESMEVQDKLSALIAIIEHSQEAITANFPNDIPQEQLPQLARNLSFLEKWQAQLQQRYGALF
ncbi:DnaJ domain-containing protein [Rubritalea sp.]|uniref:DnaJ domain-containing protein n=1 Tax=Rubritalea sp. TaxID=2109375 RepID=UPI003EF5394B